MPGVSDSVHKRERATHGRERTYTSGHTGVLMADVQDFRPSIPRGYRAYEDWLEVSGVQHHRAATRRFLAGDDPTLEFELEPGNLVDPNAIKVVGISTVRGKAKRYHLGYVERDAAAAWAASGLARQMRPLLLRTYVGDSGFIAIRYIPVGPQRQEEAYLAAFGEEHTGGPAADPTRKTVGSPPPRDGGPVVAPLNRRKSCLTVGVIALASVVVLGLLAECLPPKDADTPAGDTSGIATIVGDPPAQR